MVYAFIISQFFYSFCASALTIFISFNLQEIDGKSLILLKRLDVLTGLKLKLGPALKVFHHVAKVQQHSTLSQASQTPS